MELEDYTYIIQPREVERDDVNQEAALWEFLHPGQRANRSLIAKNLANQEPAATFSGDPTSVVCGLPSYVKLPDSKVIERLVNWSLEQSTDIRDAVLTFLDEPSDEALSQTLDILVAAGAIERAIEEPKAPKPAGDFIGALLRLFEKEPEYHIQDLYQWARGIHSAKRPEATLRQALRRLVANGVLVKLDDRYRKGGN